MVARNLLNDVLALPYEDRVAFFERLRENLLSDPQHDALTDEEKRILDERMAEYESDPDAGSPWEEVEVRLNALLKDRP